MPELPDITVYIEALDARITGQPMDNVRVTSPFLVRTCASYGGLCILTVGRAARDGDPRGMPAPFPA